VRNETRAAVVLWGMNWWIRGGIALLLLAAGCSGGDAPPDDGQSPAPSATTLTSEPTRAPAPSVTPVPDRPLHKTYARGETVDIERGVLFLDPETGGGEAWANVVASPSGMLVAWNGPDGSQPPVLFRTGGDEKVGLDTGGRPGTVLGYNRDESEVAVRAPGELLIHSTLDGAVRVRFPLAPATQYANAHWGPEGRVAVTVSGRSGASLGIAAWADGEIRSFAGAPDDWAQWSPDGRLILASQFDQGQGAFTALIDVASGELTRLELELHNPRWSASGHYFAGQRPSGELWVFRADGGLQMQLNGVCALTGTPWIGDEIATWGFGEDVLIAMDGSTRPYVPESLSRRSAELRPDGSAALLDVFRGTNVLAELRALPHVPITFRIGAPGVTPDGRGILLLGGKATGLCEHVGLFAIDMPPFE